MLYHRILLLSAMLTLSVSFLKGQDMANSTMEQTSIQVTINNDDRESALFADSLISFARKYLKTPYKMGATGTKSFDCSGFSSFVYRNFGYKLNRTARDQARENGTEITRDSLRRGDLVFFKGRNAKKDRVGHVGIVYEVFPDGDFSFIHASCKYGVTITEGRKNYYHTRFVTAKRIFDVDEDYIIQIKPLVAKDIKLMF